MHFGIYSPFKYQDIQMRFNVIGAGRLGQNLALCLMHYGHELVAITNHSRLSALLVIKALGTGDAVAGLIDLPAVDLTIITTPDDNIANIATELARSVSILPGSIVMHCSGVHSSDILQPLLDKGCLIASIHPLKAFTADDIHFDALQGCSCVLEGEPGALPILTTLFTEMGASIIPISALKKSVYHAAAVMASNYVITMAGCAAALFMEAGLPAIQAKKITQDLMQNSLDNLHNASHVADALTGPLARGDVNTIYKHLNAIKSPDINALYRTAALATLPLTQLDNDVLMAIKEQLHNHD